MEKYLKLLNQNRVLNLATSYKDNPRSSILEYIMVNGNILIMTDSKTIKAGNLAKNPKISLSVMASDPGANLEELHYLAADGTVTDADPNDIKVFNKVLIERYPEFEAFMSSGAMNNKYFRIIIDTVYYSEGMKPAEIIKVKK
ncbi:MAG: pyridoxamine 5'-phosphate oxidase family protein [Methanomassiliicoccaceae archaeon]|jgi:uncharacterized pyridoxamine 5'-phosphate oxidase family protein|nr:pyridoxamine 5'-phosphate oxidase family protein [Methanomassiliicoccaceae archaeon]